MRDATVLAKQAFVAECGTQQAGGTPPGRFDSPAIGLSAMPTVQIGAEFPMQMKVLIASSDLQWSKAGNALHSSVGIRIKEKTAAGEERVLTSQRVQLTAGDDRREPAAAELAVKPDAGTQTLRVVVRDDTNQREGSVTFPLTRISH